MLDVFFLSYDEAFADDNFELLKEHAPNAKRVHGVTGIFEAHQECARRSKTSHFYVVDADAQIVPPFAFHFKPSANEVVYRVIPETDCVFVWRSRNPINGLEYGYGGAKLFPKKRLLEAAHWNVDMTTTIGATFVSVQEVSNITAFNTDPFNTWKSAFRECTKLASSIIPSTTDQVNHRQQERRDKIERLNTWCTVGAERPFGRECILGALQGRDFGLAYQDRPDILGKINDFEWLRKQFNENT